MKSAFGASHFSADHSEAVPRAKVARSLRWQSFVIFALVASMLGITSLVGPGIVTGKIDLTGGPREIMRGAIDGEGASRVSIAGFVVSGFILGALTLKPRWLIAVCCVAFLPVWSITDGLIHPRDHNLLPFEFFFHAIFGFIVWVGTLFGRSFRALVLSSRRQL